MSNPKTDPKTATDNEHDDIMYPSVFPFVLVHLACIAAIWTEITWQSVAQSTAQKSVLWWAAKHRHHHLHSDTEHDVHSPRHKGFLIVTWGGSSPASMTQPTS